MRVLIILISILFSVMDVEAQNKDTVQVYGKFETSFQSEITYDNYITDVRVRVRFEGPDGKEITQDAFWDGENIFKVRFSPPGPGIWRYKTISSDTNNESLQNLSGQFLAEEYAGNNDFQKHGWLRVSDNNRYLTYMDGTPFFYLGDTAWEISWKSTREELLTYLDNREEKGFTAVQFVPMSHQRLFSYGVVNRDGDTYFVDENYSKLNPEYFEYVDEIVNEINKRGMVAVIVPLWAGMNELHYDPRWRDTFMTIEESLPIAKYIGARYAADNVIWIVGGDNVYDTAEKKAFWNEFATLLEQSSGHRHLATVHPSGWNASFNYFDHTTPWLDFHMYQSSHIARADYTITAATQGYAKTPVMPVLNGEAVYEDIYNRLWAPGDTTKAEGTRIQPEHVRQTGYESILSGAIVGYTYGGNGIWQWHKGELWASHSPRFEVMEAIDFPASFDMTVLKSIMTEHNWFSFKPKPEYVVNRDSRNKITTAVNDDFLVSYYATGTNRVNYQLPLNQRAVSAKFINPSTGEETAFNSGLGLKFEVQPPDTMDWVFVAELEKTDTETPENFTLYQNFPNPFNPATSIQFYLKEPAAVSLKVYDSLGRLVRLLTDSKKEEGFHSIPFDGGFLSSGVYYYRIETENNTQTKKMILVK